MAHEIAHVLRHVRTRNDFFIDDLTRLETAQEREANEAAREMIQAREITKFFGSFEYVSESRVRNCAASLGVGTAVVVGVLQHEGRLSPRNLNRLKEPVSNKIPADYWVEKNPDLMKSLCRKLVNGPLRQ